jgi:hypothetical protein
MIGKVKAIDPIGDGFAVATIEVSREDAAKLQNKIGDNVVIAWVN